jgi:hypothetical protein
MYYIFFRNFIDFPAGRKERAVVTVCGSGGPSVANERSAELRSAHARTSSDVCLVREGLAELKSEAIRRLPKGLKERQHAPN